MTRLLGAQAKTALSVYIRESLQIDRFQVRLNDYGDNQFQISTKAIKAPIGLAMRK